MLFVIASNQGEGQHAIGIGVGSECQRDHVEGSRLFTEFDSEFEGIWKWNVNGIGSGTV